VNGELRVGDTVISIEGVGYSYLIGTVLEINKVGSSEHLMETDNDTDDIHVEFTGADYSEKRILEVEETLTKLYGEKKSFYDSGLDDVIMPPEFLIKADALSKEAIEAILNSEKSAAIICSRILKQSVS